MACVAEFLLQARAAYSIWNFSILVLVCAQSGRAGRVVDQKKNRNTLIPNRGIDYTPRMVTPRKVFRINCVVPF